MNKYRSLYNTTLSLLINLLLVMGCFVGCRLIFLAENWNSFSNLTIERLWKMFQGGFIFDTSAILYTNLLYIFLMLLPLHYKERTGYQKVTRMIFLITNSLVLMTNLMDTVYFQYTHRRTTASIFNEFKNENNLAGIFGVELINHWYLVIAAIALVFILIKGYRRPKTIAISNRPLYYSIHTLTLALGVYLCIGGMRGGFTGMVRPITISNANQYVDNPMETGIVLNTPFSIYRTIGKKSFQSPQYFDKQQLAQIYSPVHSLKQAKDFTPLNVVVFILESFSKENSGYLNQELDNGTYQGFTPFLDSLMKEGLTFKHAFANGMKSIDGMPSILSGIPMFVEPFFLTPASLNTVSSIGGELKKKGYYTAFFHGADNGSMGFEAYARTSGYSDYFGRTEYNQAHPGNNDFDGNWGIWDEKFFQFYADEMAKFPQPFATALFSLSSHHPFAVPAEYEGKFPKGNKPIRQCIAYTDNALRLFFEKAQKMPWFANTLFVFTADHTNSQERPMYETSCGLFSVPVVFYHPGSQLKGFNEESIAQQIDIMPTVLNYLGYDQPYVSFGCDLLSTPAANTYAVNYINGVYQYIKGNYLLQFDGERTLGVYAFKTDKLLNDNLIGKVGEQETMEKELKAIIQQYMNRMNNDELVVK